MKLVLILLGVLLLLGLLVFFAPVLIRVHYLDDKLQARAWLGPIPINLLSDEEKKAKKNAKRQEGREDRSSANRLFRRIQDYLEDLKQIWELLPILRRVLIVDKLSARVLLGGDDPGDLALHYGQAWAVIGSLLSVVQSLFTVKQHDCQPIADPAAKSFDFQAHIHAHLTIFHAIRVLLQYYSEKGNYPDPYSKTKKETKV